MTEQIERPAKVVGHEWPSKDALPEMLAKPGLFVKGEYAWGYADRFGAFVATVGAGTDEMHKTMNQYASHENPRYRMLALYALAKSWPDDKETVAQLHRAADDAKEDVRWVAIRTLTRHFARDPQTQSILRQHALNDSDNLVRSVSLTSLQYSYGSNAQNLVALRDRAINDSQDDIRKSAIDLLAKYYEDDPATLELLLRVSREDSNDEVRVYAKELSEMAMGNQRQMDSQGTG